MMANTSGSTNQENNLISPTPRPIRTEKAPLIQRKFFRNLRGALGFDTSTSSSLSQSQGYVQFEGFQRQGRTLGTFAGVFSPVALSMFSALLFLRVGFIVGNAGILITIIQFIIAYGILIFTVASVCAVSTNGAVEGGGAYFMISRTLGPEFGGSIGTLFFLANVVSSALYIVGCAEGFVENFGPSGYLAGSDGTGLLPDGRWWRFLYCSVLNFFNLIVCLIGAGMFAKLSVVILAVVCICLFSTLTSFLVMGPKQVEIPLANNIFSHNASYPIFGNYTGLSSQTLHNNLWSNYTQDYSSDGDPSVNFAIVFGVLFSGVTGIMAGANMSGELRDPAKNIPKGTLSAVGFTFICYTVVSILTAATCDRFLLQNNFIFLLPINIWPPFITIGILTATFSASLSNLIGSSRVLEALAKDNVFGSMLQFVSKGVWRGNPIAAVVFSWFLVQMILFIGSLNTIAQINSVLFLLSYLATNLACLGLELTSAPNFRPSFKYFTWYTALIGLIGTFFMMFVINPIYASSSIVLCLVLVIVLHLFSPSKHADWGSISQALIFHQVRKYLLMLDSRKDHVKFWRPQMLLMVQSPKSVCPLIQFVNDLKKSGLYVLGHVKVGDFHRLKIDPTLDEYPHWLSLIDHLKVKAFVEITVSDSVRNGVQHMIRMSGLGAMKPNTIVLGYYDDSEPFDFFHSSTNFQTNQFDGLFNSDGSPLFHLRGPQEKKQLSSSEYVGIVSDILRMKKNVCICRHFQNLDKTIISKSYKYIDVWPINFFQPEEYDLFDTTSLFMLQLACIINMVPTWKHLKLRVFLCENEVATNSNTPFRNNEDKMKQLLQQLRITAKIYQVTSWPQQYESLKGYSLFPSTHLEVLSDNKARAYLLSINQMIMQNSDLAAATFIYLPAPPNDGTTAVAKQYLRFLTEMTAELPPLILVHGVSAVTSTTL